MDKLITLFEISALIEKLMILEIDKDEYFTEELIDALAKLHQEIKPIIKKASIGTPNETNEVYMCCVCHKVPVDALDGYDTCPSCAAKI